MGRYRQTSSGQLETGVVIVLFGGQAFAGAHVERSADGVSGWERVGTFDDIDQSGTAFFDSLPMDDVTRYYRAKHVEPGYTDGPYSDIVDAKPTLIPNVDYSTKPWLRDGLIPLQLVMDVFSETSTTLHVTASVNRDPASVAEPVVSVLSYFGVNTPTPTGSYGWTITKPASGFGRVSFRNTLAGRIDDTDSVDVQAASSISTDAFLGVFMQVTSSTATTLGVSASINNPQAVPVGVGVHQSNNVGTVTRDADGRYTIARPTSGEGTVIFAVTSSDTTVVPDYDTVYVSKDNLLGLSTKTTVLAGVTTSSMFTRTDVYDPMTSAGVPQGITLLVQSQSLLSMSVTETSTSSTTGYVSYFHTITRPYYGQGTGRVTFIASKTGLVQDSDSVEVPERVDGVARLRVDARTGASSATTQIVTVTVTDQLPQTGSYIYLRQDSTGIANITPNSGSYHIASGDSKTFTITRPVYGAGAGRVVFTATASLRVPDTDAIDIGEATQSLTDASKATITVSAGTATATLIPFNYSFASDSTTTLVEVWALEHTTDPGTATSVEYRGFVPVGSPIEASAGGSGVFNVPVAKAGSYMLVTFVPYNEFNRKGPKSNIKAQAALGGGSLPSAFASAVGSSVTSTTVTNTVTMPASNLPTTINGYVDGVFHQAFTVTAGAGVGQSVQHTGLNPNTTYTFTYKAQNSNGENATATTAFTATTSTATLSAPSLTFSHWEDVAGGRCVFSVTPGSGNPEGVYHALYIDAGGGYTLDNTQVNTTMYYATTSGVGVAKVKATKTGYTDSGYSNEVTWNGGTLF